MLDEKVDLPPFYPGQAVLCVETHRQGLVKEGLKYIVDHCCKKGCKCPGLAVCIRGILSTDIFGAHCPINMPMVCGSCGKLMLPSELHPFGATRFRAIQELPVPLIKLSQIAEKEKEQVLIEN